MGTFKAVRDEVAEMMEAILNGADDSMNYITITYPIDDDFSVGRYPLSGREMLFLLA